MVRKASTFVQIGCFLRKMVEKSTKILYFWVKFLKRLEAIRVEIISMNVARKCKF